MMFEQCVDQGGDEARCAMAAREELDRCVKEHCAPPQPPPCADRCDEVAAHVFDACTSKLDAPRLCEHVARWVLEHCNQKCVPSEKPCVCPAIFDPVCGADGNIYSNACEADCAGVGLGDPGQCEGDDSDSDSHDGDSDSHDGDSDSHHGGH